jgi:hypothetical protein
VAAHSTALPLPAGAQKPSRQSQSSVPFLHATCLQFLPAGGGTIGDHQLYDWHCENDVKLPNVHDSFTGTPLSGSHCSHGLRSLIVPTPTQW